MNGFWVCSKYRTTMIWTCFPFVGGIIYLCCGLEDEAPVTKTFTVHVDLVEFMYPCHTVPVSDYAELSKIRDIIPNFKSTPQNEFSCYQPSRLRKTNWNSLEHVLYNMEELGGINYLHRDLLRSATSFFEDDYNLTSKRTKNAMWWTIQKQLEREFQSCV